MEDDIQVLGCMLPAAPASSIFSIFPFWDDAAARALPRSFSLLAGLASLTMKVPQSFRMKRAAEPVGGDWFATAPLVAGSCP